MPAPLPIHARYVAASIASLYLYLAGMCVFAGKRDPKVLFTCFFVLTSLLSLGAVCNRCGVAERICVRIDASRGNGGNPAPSHPCL